MSVGVICDNGEPLGQVAKVLGEIGGREFSAFGVNVGCSLIQIGTANGGFRGVVQPDAAALDIEHHAAGFGDLLQRQFQLFV